MDDNKVNSVDLDVRPQGGTSFGNIFKCCFPKKAPVDESSPDAVVGQKSRSVGPYGDDPDKSESGLVYFDLPETEGDDDEEKRQQQQAIQGPPLVMEFWKFIFSLLMLDWLRHNNEHQKKQIKAE